MTTVVRSITPAEALDYLRVLPAINGLPLWEPAPAAWYGGRGAWPARQPVAEADLPALVDVVMADGFHPQAAFVDGRIVGGSAMLSLELTVPGRRVVPLGGVTSTGVIATHRRRGLLRQMMQAMFDDALERGEPVAALSASEGSIYGRFGFAPATTRTRWEIERADAALLEHGPPTGTLELVDAATARTVWPQIHESVRRDRVGEISSRPKQWAGLSDAPSGADGPLRYVVHRDSNGNADGIANYRLPWVDDVEGVGTLVVEAFQTRTDAAYRALWALLLDFDLTRRVVAPNRPADEPLRWLLRNPRALRVTRQSDNLWVRVLDVPAALAARAYNDAGSLVFVVEDDALCPQNAGAWRLETTGDGASCTRATAEPDLTVDIQSLGALYLGGVSPFILAAAGRIREHRSGAVAELSRLVRSDPEPFNSFGF